jgi:2-polyprenyl-6-methoxyphenol hydroxylase-like FAD-dependent oxidoreductase
VSRATRSLEGLEVAVVGGSIVGCTAAAALAAIGCRVTVLERSRGALQTRGSGLVLPGRLIPSLLARGLLPSEFEWRQVPNRNWIVKDGDVRMGRLIWQQPFTVSAVSWAGLFKAFRAGVPDGHYRQGCEVVSLAQDDDGVALSLANGETVSVDMVVAADGYLSTIRELLFADQAEQSYSGYLVWRGWFNEWEGLLSSVEHLDGPMKTVGFERGHGSTWLIPSAEGGSPGKRQITWNIYGGPLPPGVVRQDGAVSSAHGALTDEQLVFLHEFVDEAMPPAIAEVAKVTPQPIFTPVYDVTVPSLVSRRVVLLGDAGTVVRPVTGSGAVKGLEDVMALADALMRDRDDIDTALAMFDAERLPVGLGLVELGKRMGTALVDEAPDWGAMSAEELEGWMTQVTAGWYATEEGRARAAAREA